MFVVSTYGDGEPTFDAFKFFEYMNDKSHAVEHLAHTDYAVFGPGDSGHEIFCGMAVNTDANLERLGARRLVPLGKGDAKTDSTDADFAAWKSTLWPVLEQEYKF